MLLRHADQTIHSFSVIFIHFISVTSLPVHLLYDGVLPRHRENTVSYTNFNILLLTWCSSAYSKIWEGQDIDLLENGSV